MTTNDEVEIRDEDIQHQDLSEEELANDETDWKAKFLEEQGKSKRRATKLAKAKDKIKSLSEAKPEIKPQDKIEIKTPNEPDYAKLAFLEVRGVQHPDDVKIVVEEAERLKLSLTDVLGMKHIQSQLETNKDARTAKDGLPPGTKRTGGYTQHDVEYYLANPDKRPADQELAEKVLHAKMNQEKKTNTFSDIMFEG